MPPRKERPLVVLDTNIIVSSAVMQKPGAARAVVLLWKRGFLQLVTSDAIIREYLLTLGRFVLSQRQMDSWARWFVHPTKTTRVTDPRNVRASRDPKDNPFLGAAITGGADFILTRDNDLLVLGSFEEIPILSPAEFLERRRANKTRRQR